VLVAPAQNAQFWTARVLIGSTPMDAHIAGGYARALLETVDDTLSRAEW
jgi:hypothetical protein